VADVLDVTLFATGGAFTNGIVSRPTLFDMGLMGEKTPEAIMPLANIGGSLGVRAVGGGTDNETKALLRELISEIQAARAGELFAIAKHTARTTAVVERVSGKGNSFAVRTLEGETVATETAA
jgi:phage-related minor tail protein